MNSYAEPLLIRPITTADLDAVLHVYVQCEDFLALGPVAHASMEMVLGDLEVSKKAGGIFCGIFSSSGEVLGVIDYVPSNFAGNPAHAFLELLMIAVPFRNQGIGRIVVEQIEAEIHKDPQVTAILSGVQVNNPAGIAFRQKMGYHITSEARKLPDQTIVYDLLKISSQIRD